MVNAVLKLRAKYLKTRVNTKEIGVTSFLSPQHGTPGAIRTRGLSLRRRTLYPAELRAHIMKFR